MKNNLILVNEKLKKIDNDYFRDYGGGDYSKNYINYTYHPKNILKQLVNKEVPCDTILDAGCASGELVRDFRNLGVKSYGIENNKEILNNSVIPKYCVWMDLLNLKSIKDKSFDVVYSNALMYLDILLIPSVLKEFNRISSAVFLCNPMLGETNPTNDIYRTFLAKPSWWDKQFHEANFNKISKNIYAAY